MACGGVIVVRRRLLLLLAASRSLGAALIDERHMSVGEDSNEGRQAGCCIERRRAWRAGAGRIFGGCAAVDPAPSQRSQSPAAHRNRLSIVAVPSRRPPLARIAPTGGRTSYFHQPASSSASMPAMSSNSEDDDNDQQFLRDKKEMCREFDFVRARQHLFVCSAGASADL